MIVTYYLRSLDEALLVVEDFSAATGIKFSHITIIDNSGYIQETSGNSIGGPIVQVIDGDNSFWEFSGWVRGLRQIATSDHDIVVLLNDSYRRNWTVRWPGRFILAAMMRDAKREKVSGWLDNFSRTERKVNSRVVVTSSSQVKLLQSSIEQAIAACRAKPSLGPELFDERTATRLRRWMASQNGRWSAASASSRWPRIFVEHHLFDSIPKSNLRLRPKLWLSSQLYGIARKLAGERR